MSPKKSNVFPIIVATALGACGTLGLVIGFGLPAYLRRQARSKQTACKTALKEAYVAEKSWFAEKDLYSENPSLIGLGTSPVLRVFGPSAAHGRPDPIAEAIHAHVNGRLGVSGHCPTCDVTIGCGANIDTDPEVDVWPVSTADRTSAGGKRIPAGVPYNDFDDLTDAPGE